MYIARFLGNKLDTFVVGRVSDSTQMGIYNVASDLSSLPARELTVATGRALFPSLAAAKSDMNVVRQIFLKVMEAVAIFCIPMAAGIWVLSEEFVMVLLGAKWRGAIDLLGWLAIYGTLGSLFSLMIGHILIVTRHERRQTLLMWTRLLALGVFAVGGATWGVLGIAVGATIASVFMIAVAAFSLNVSVDLPYRDMMRVVWRPTLAALLMALIVRAVIEGVDLMAGRLAVGVIVGCVSYLAALIAMWQISGRPDGLIAAAVAVVHSKVASRTAP